MKSVSRRSFLKATSVAAGASVLPSVPLVHVGGPEEIKVGVIGVGGRGTGAVSQALSTKGPVKLWAAGDMFADRLDGSLAGLTEDASLKSKVDLADSRRFTGVDAWKGVLDSGVDVVVLATPPHFRPHHFEMAIDAGKHVFCEKPIAVDSPGVRRFLAAAKKADEKKLSVVSGLQRHYQNGYVAAMEKVHDGALGRILFARCAWNMGGLWMHRRKPEWSDMEWQLRNWLYFTWLSGDHIVEQHVHNLDVINWAMQAHPIRARGMGGRQVRTDPAYGHIFDHHAVQYEYENGAWLFSECRQIDGCANDVSEHLYGTDGEAHFNDFTITGKEAWKYEGPGNNPYQSEHDAMFASIRSGTPINAGYYVAESTLTAIMGRMATYSGRVVTWDEAMNSDERWGPTSYEFGPLPVDPVPMPGKQRAKKG